MTDYPRDIFQKGLSILGMIGPIFHITLIVILGRLWSGYNPIVDFISELGAVDSPFGPYMQFLGYSLLGVIWIFFAIGLYRGVIKYGLNTACLILLLIAGFTMVLLGFLPCDSKCVPITLPGHLHAVVGAVADITFMVGLHLIIYPIAKDPNFPNIWWICTLILLLISDFFIILTLAFFTSPIVGIFQRTSIFTLLFLTFLLSAKLFQLTKSKSNS